jgi:hypothetical protein
VVCSLLADADGVGSDHNAKHLLPRLFDEADFLNFARGVADRLSSSARKLKTGRIADHHRQ